MSSTYYDSATTGAGTSITITTDSDTATTGSCTYTIAITSACSNSSHYEPKRYLVAVPKKWKRKEELAFIKLVNEQTKTGFKITMLIHGDILIVDPTIERRTMADFVPLLKHFANDEDTKRISAFFSKHKA